MQNLDSFINALVSVLFFIETLVTALQVRISLHDSDLHQDHSLLENPIARQLIDTIAGDNLLLENHQPCVMSVIRGRDDVYQLRDQMVLPISLATAI